jgi:hypothetical protein
VNELVPFTSGARLIHRLLYQVMEGNKIRIFSQNERRRKQESNEKRENLEQNLSYAFRACRITVTVAN